MERHLAREGEREVRVWKERRIDSSTAYIIVIIVAHAKSAPPT